jgi:hypothetical protein
MRLRKTVVKQRCQPLFSDNPGALGRVMDCEQAIYWGLDDVTYKRVAKNGFPQCTPAEEELKIYRATDIKKRRDLPFYVKQETCIRDAMQSGFERVVDQRWSTRRMEVADRPPDTPA